MISGRKVFITGGAGFIGSTLVSRLADDNEVVVYDSFDRNALQSHHLGHKHVRILRGDILDAEALNKAIRGAEIVVHCAAVAGIDTVIKRPVRTMTVNTTGTANVLEAAANLDTIDRVVCFSTSEVFGQHAFRPDERDRTVIGPVGEARWIYAVSKVAVEHLAVAYYQERGLPISIVRPFNVYGPGQVGEGALRIFIQNALLHAPIEIHGDGSQIRAWCYVDDMVDGVLLAASLPQAVGESFNIGNQRAITTIYGLANTVVRVLGSRSEIMFIEKNYADVELRVPSVKKARELLGFDARVDLEEGIERTAGFYRHFPLKEVAAA